MSVTPNEPPPIHIIPMAVAARQDGGARLEVAFSFAPSPQGLLLVAATAHGVCHLMFVQNEKQGLADLKARWPQAQYRQYCDAHQQQALAGVLNRMPVSPLLAPVPLHVAGSPFELAVWQQLLQVPAGTLSTYGQVAAELGQPKAARAVGRAIGKNAIAVLIPCHRVVRADGQLGGYRWGCERKQALIAAESLRVQS